MQASNQLKYLNQKEATQLDEELMGPVIAYSTEQLMELAGLSSAMAVHRTYPARTHPRALIVCGPGNNGGDGLVCSRHMRLFGYSACTVCYPKRTDRPLYKSLVAQAQATQVTFVDSLPDAFETQFDVVVDAIFGFSFKGDIRAPFDTIIRRLTQCKIPVASIDIPSGWDVNEGNVSGHGLNPQMLISLSAPKLCAKKFQGIHWLGGRFVPPSVATKFEMNLPQYPGDEQVVLLSGKLF